MSQDDPVTFFEGDYAFLSNFWRSPIPFDGGLVTTVEHAFQASKTLDKTLRLQIATTPSPGKAKRFGRAVPLRPDWEVVKIDVMRDCLRLKFAPGSELAARLVETFPRILLEGNTWGDRTWGVVDGHGQNLLGQLLMAIRAELRTGITTGPALHPVGCLCEECSAAFEREKWDPRG